MLAIDSLSEACVQGSVYASGAVNCLVDVYKLHSCGARVYREQGGRKGEPDSWLEEVR